MRKIIYTKYSNDRDLQYNIKTRIEEDQLGSRFVRKYPDSCEGIDHIKNMYDNCCKLGEVFGESLSMNVCRLHKDNSIEFEYLVGKNLEELMTISDNPKALAEKFISILESKASYQFTMTEEFKEYFKEADYSLLEGKKSLKYSNVDMLFSNILVVGERWINIDYEWVCKFPVPVDFIIYRALYYCKAKNVSVMLKERFTKEEIELFYQMDRAFQRYVMKDHRYLGEMYENIVDNTFRENYAAKEDDYLYLRHVMNLKDQDIVVLQQTIENMNNSLSFKITKPLRTIKSIVKGKK